MENIVILVSSAAFAAVAIGGASSRFNVNSWFKKRRAANAVALAPTPVRENGWQFIYCDDSKLFDEWLRRDEYGLPPMGEDDLSLGSHLLVELFGCDHASLEQEHCVGAAMRQAADASKATIVAESFHEFQPYGVSGAVIIQESHYTIHTWPEHGYAAVDLFYCGGTVEVHKALDVLRSRFRPTKMKFLVVRRGLQTEFR